MDWNEGPSASLPGHLTFHDGRQLMRMRTEGACAVEARSAGSAELLAGLVSFALWGTIESHGIWGSMTSGRGQCRPALGLEKSGTIGRDGSVGWASVAISGSWLAMALWWKSVISIAAVSMSTIPSLLASICSSVAVSMGMDVLDGPGAETSGALLEVRRFCSLWRGTPPSFAWTVRSCRSSRSRRTKVLRHFMHLKGRSLVSVDEGQVSVNLPRSATRSRTRPHQ